MFAAVPGHSRGENYQLALTASQWILPGQDDITGSGAPSIMGCVQSQGLYVLMRIRTNIKATGLAEPFPSDPFWNVGCDSR